MTSQEMLQKYTRREEDTEGDEVEDQGGWGLLRGIRERCLAVSLIKRDGTILAIPYPTIDQFLFSPTDGITIRAAGREVRIKGKRLNDSGAKTISLFMALTRGRVSWIAEPSRDSQPPANASASIENITW